MKVGHIIDGLEVVDVKRVNKMNLIQFTKAVSEYIELGYKIDVHSSRQVGLVLSVDCYKLESNLSNNVGSVGNVEDTSTEGAVKEPNETTIEALQESTEKLETVETIDEVIEEALSDLKEGGQETNEDVEVEETTPPIKKTRAKKTT